MKTYSATCGTSTRAIAKSVGLPLSQVASKPRQDRRSIRSIPVIQAASKDEESNGFLDSIFGQGSNPLSTESGTLKLRVGSLFGGSSERQTKAGASFLQKKGSQDTMTVFVAGSSGRLGIRIVYELAAAGFKVRAGVRSQEKADAFDDQLDALCDSIGPLDRKSRSLINLVYCDLQDKESIKPAIGNASRVICAVGAAESEFTNLAAPKLIDYEATETLINVASSCKIPQFILVTSLGTGKIGFPAGVLNLFGGILIWKRKAEEALEQSGMPYLIVRPGGMERPKDNHKEKFNVRLSTRDTLFGGTVSRLQVAELVTAAVCSPETATNKCVEVVAETEAPLMEYSSLLNSMPVEVDQTAREEALVELSQLESRQTELADEIDRTAKDLAETRDVIADLQVSLKESRAEQKAVRKENIDAVEKAIGIESEIGLLRQGVEEKKLLALAAKTAAQAQQKGISIGEVLSMEEINEIKNSILYPPVEEEEEEEEQAKTSERSKGADPLFGFLQKRAPVVDDYPPVSQEQVEEIVDGAEDDSIIGSLMGFLEGDGRRGVIKPKSSPKKEEIKDTPPTEEASPVKENGVNTTGDEDGGIFGSLKSMFRGQETAFIDELEGSEASVTQPATMPVQETNIPQGGNGIAQDMTATEPEEEKSEPGLEPVREDASSGFPDIGSFIKPISLPSTPVISMPWQEEMKCTDVAENPTSASDVEEVRAWIASWKTRTLSREEKEADNVVEARQWIAAWRQRNRT